MTYRAITLRSILILCLMWTGSAFGQAAEDRIAAIEDEIADMKGLLEKILAERKAVDRMLADVIVLTDQDCKDLEGNWKRYEAIDGRFPLAAGTNTDNREEEKTFTIGQRGGEYRHKLNEAEMPSHAHQRSIHPVLYDKVDHGDDWSTHHGHRETVTTTKSGGDQPHENMPPYLVMHFCHKVENP